MLSLTRRTYTSAFNALEQLLLYDLSLTGEIPDSLYDLPNLEVLSLNGNSLEGSISSRVGNLVKLTNLAVNDNPLLTGTLPSELGRCEDLGELYIARHFLQGFQQSNNLSLISEFFHVQNTQIEGTVPQEGRYMP